MRDAKNTKSIRQPILFTTLGFVFVVLALTIWYFVDTLNDKAQKQLDYDIKRWASYIAELNIDDLQQSAIPKLTSKLNAFKVLKNISTVKIYQYQAQNEEYVAVAIYDHIKGISNDPQQSRMTAQQSEHLFTPSIDNDLITYGQPVRVNGQTIGLVVLQLDVNSEVIFTNQMVIVIIVLLFVVFVAVLLVSFRLENKITLPLKQLSNNLVAISQAKDYSMRVDPLPYKEVDILAKNINYFLQRIERHVTQLGLAEQQSLKLNIELEDKVNKRTQALKESNQELLSTLEKLHQYQDQLVESEKMASLGDMVAGVAHEVNTPIGLGVTASTLLLDRLNEITTAFEEKTLKSSQLKKFLNEGGENVGIIYRNLKRAAELISSFKKVAVDQSSEEFRQFNFAELLNEILLTLAPQIKKTPYQIDFDCPADLMIVSRPGPINQILINLILNSITHGFDKRDHGSICVTVMKLGEQLNIHYQDDGIGIDPAIKDKIFEPFTTTKRGEGGSGLGLHLVYNLVTQALGGSIRLESEPNKGAVFEISFPISEQLL